VRREEEVTEEAPSCRDEQSAMSKRCREKLARERLPSGMEKLSGTA